MAYDERWTQLDAGAGGARAQTALRYEDIPWPLEPPGRSSRAEQPPPPPSADALRDFLLLGASGPADVKRRLRVELLRWHPDKFGARFGARLAGAGPAQHEAALLRVQQLAQVLTQVLGPGAAPAGSGASARKEGA